MSAPNIVNVSTITGKTAVLAAVGTSATNLVGNSASSNKVFKVNSIIVSNDHSSAVTLTVDLYRSASKLDVICSYEEIS